MSSWIGKFLSNDDRLILINSVLMILLMFLLSFLEILSEATKFPEIIFFGKVMATKESID
jgi:hypothetical protein